MSGDTVAILIIGIAVVLSPVLTMYWPKFFGLIGVVALTAAGIYYAVAGKSALTETTAAVLIVGAFMLSATLAIYRLFERGGGDEE
mgnify:CR=1 FL=1